MMQTKREYYPGITIFKVIGAVLVLFGHIKLPDAYQHLTASVAGAAAAAAIVVPCFYIVSGFLACNSWQHSLKPAAYLKRHLGWLTIIYCAFCSIYIFGTLLPSYLQQPLSQAATISFLKKAGNILLSRGYPHLLYFVPPLIFGTIMSFIFERTGKLRLGMAIAVAGFLFAQLVSGTFTAFCPAVSAAIGSKLLKALIVHNLGLGFPFVFAGVFIANYYKTFLNFKATYLALLCIICLGVELTALNYVTGRSNFRIGISIVPSSVFLFFGVLNIKASWVQRYHRQLNSFSIVTYFTHYFFIRLSELIISPTGRNLSVGETVIYFLITFTGCIVATTVFIKLSDKKKAKAAPAQLQVK